MQIRNSNAAFSLNEFSNLRTNKYKLVGLGSPSDVHVVEPKHDWATYSEYIQKLNALLNVE